MTASTRRKWKGLALFAAMFLVVGFAATGQQAVRAQHGVHPVHAHLTSNPTAGNVDSIASPMWQTNNTVWALAYNQGIVYAGGSFTSVRPPGDALGTGENPVTYLASFNSADGTWIHWAPSFNGAVYALAVSPDHSTLYVGGNFTQAGGAAHYHIAAINIATGAIIPTFKPNAGNEVRSISVSPDGSTVYIGGNFGKVNNVVRTYAAAVDSTETSTPGQLLPFDPSMNGDVTSIAVSPDDSRVLIGGYFSEFNGVTQQAIGSVDPLTGASDALTDIVPNYPGCSSTVKDIIISGPASGPDTAYIADEGTGGGCFDGDWALDVSSGNVVWQNDCLGATQAIEIVNGWLYKGSHAHDCAYSAGGFPQLTEPSGNGWVTHHLLDQSLTDGSLGFWGADTNAPGGVEPLGPGDMTTDGSQLFVGGDFTVVNNQAQQGLIRFGAADTTTPTRPIAPVATNPYAGAVQVSFQASSDRADGSLTYNIYRSGTTAAIASVTATSWPWSLPVIHYMDTKVAAGKTYTYKVSASNGTNTSSVSPASNAVTVSATNPTSSYDQTVESDFPTFFWPLNDGSGSTTAQDLSLGGLNTGVYSGGVTPDNTTGPLAGSSDAAPTFDGSSGNVDSANQIPTTPGFSIEGWFKTSTKDGGKIVGYGDQPSGSSNNYDRHVYMMNDGQVVFGVWIGNTETIESKDAYNDGQWHFFVATQDPTAGMSLYIDGQLVGTNSTTTAQGYTGYWRVGGDNLNGWNLDPWGGNSQGTTEPLSYWFGGTIADVAEFPLALSQAQVEAQYDAALYPTLNG